MVEMAEPIPTTVRKRLLSTLWTLGESFVISSGGSFKQFPALKQKLPEQPTISALCTARCGDRQVPLNWQSVPSPAFQSQHRRMNPVRLQLQWHFSLSRLVPHS